MPQVRIRQDEGSHRFDIEVAVVRPERFPIEQRAGFEVLLLGWMMRGIGLSQRW